MASVFCLQAVSRTFWTLTLLAAVVSCPQMLAAKTVSSTHAPHTQAPHTQAPHTQAPQANPADDGSLSDTDVDDIDTASLGQKASNDIRAQVRPTEHTVISSEIAGKITKLTVREGDHFQKGQLLVSFDCSVYRAKLEHSVAAETGAEVKLHNAVQLAKLNGISKAALADAQSQYAMSRAATALDRAMVGRCNIVAPFSGRASAVRVQQFAFVPEGTPMLDIYDDSALEIEMIVPSRWLAWLNAGYPFAMHVDETGRGYQAKVVRISASVDPVSQTVKIFGRIVGPEGMLLPGMSGTATFAPPRSAARNNARH